MSVQDLKKNAEQQDFVLPCLPYSKHLHSILKVHIKGKHSIQHAVIPIMGHGSYWQRAHLFKKIQTIRKDDEEKEEKDLPLPQER